MLKKKINFGRLKKKMARNNLPLIGNEIVTSIILRTQKGKDVKNRKFKGYTKEYKATKKEKYGASVVNLTAGGKMLNDISWKKLPNGIRIYFKSSQQNKKAHGNQIKNKRKFFGIDPIQLQKIKQKLTILSKS